MPKINAGPGATLAQDEVKSELQLLKEFSDEILGLPKKQMELRIKIHVLNTLDVALRRRARRLKAGEKKKALRVKTVSAGIFAGIAQVGIPDRIFPAMTHTLEIISRAGGIMDLSNSPGKLDDFEALQLRVYIRNLGKIDRSTIGRELRNAREDLKNLTT